MVWSFLVKKQSKNGLNDTYQHIILLLGCKLLTELSTSYQQSYQQLRLKTLVVKSVA